MLVDLLILAPFAIALAVLSLPAPRRTDRATRRSPRAAAAAAAPRPEAQPSGDEPQPFAYDSGLKTGGRES